MDIYATHLPILQRISFTFDTVISRVLEFGAGQYSTPTFLDREYFPYLHTLVSYETDQGWYESIRELLSSPRLALMYAKRPLEEIAKEVNYTFFDLVFVDNGAVQEERIAVLEALNHIQPSSLVVVHDYDVEAYQQATRDFPIKIVYSELTPYTAILISKNCPYLNNYVVME